MFHLYQSHSLEKLAQALIEVAETSAPRNPLQQSWIIVQNNEIKEWLSLKFARHQGIAGNFRFIFPSEFLWVMYRLKEPDVPERLPGDLNAMQWALFELFDEQPSLLSDIPFYREGTDSTQHQFRFCSRLADVFDQYQMYRPEMMEGWLKGKASTKSPHEKWQLGIWRKLNQRWKGSSTTQEHPRRSQAFLELKSWMQTDNQLINKLPDQFYVFGLSHAPKSFIEITSLTAKQKNVHYFLRYAENNEDEDPQTVPPELKQKWAKPLYEQQQLIHEMAERYELPFSKNELSNKQNLSDVALHACHNKRREAEVLKDEILYFLDEHPDCSVNDILVMVPDAEEYAGVLEAVFSNQEQEPGLPVSRLSGGGRESVQFVFSELLELLDSDFKVSEVLQFMQHEVVQSRFGFSESEMDDLEYWILENQVHRGLGEKFNDRYSLLKGLNQLLAGYSLEMPDYAEFHGIIPFSGISSSDDAELTARLSRFIHALQEAVHKSESAKNAHQWLEFVLQMVQTFIGDHESNELQATALTVSLTRLKEQIALAETKRKIPYNLFRNWLQTQLSNQDSLTARFGHGIRVSTYVPYRSVPFRYIGVLGMNEGVFPRKAIRPEFDLIYEHPQAGDRILKEDDLCLFLEMLEAATDHLHLSYKAFMERKDARKLPSMPVQQLLESKGSDPQEAEITHHLHGFNRSYFSEDRSKATYSDLKRELAENIAKRGDEAAPFLHEKLLAEFDHSEEPMDLYDLHLLLTHPCKYLVQNELNIKNYDDFQEISDREPFDLNKLQEHKLKAFLSDGILQDVPDDQLFKYADAYPYIPEGMKGEKVFKSFRKNMSEYVENLKQLTKPEEQVIPVDLQMHGVSVHGDIKRVFGDSLVHFRPGKLRAKDELSWLLDALILRYNGFPLERMVFLYMDGGVELIEYDATELDKDSLPGLLDSLFKKEPWLHKTCFFPDTSKKYAEIFLEENDRDKALEKAQSAWKQTRHTPFTDEADYYNRLIWNHLSFFNEEYFQDNALQRWKLYHQLSQAGGQG